MARSYRGCFEYRIGLGGPYLGLAAAERAPMAVENTPPPGVRDNAPTFIASLAGTAAALIQRGFDAANQDGSSEGLARKQVAPTLSARARTLSSGKAVI